METIEVVAIAAALFTVALLVGWLLVRRGRFGPARRMPTEPAPAAWRALIESRVPITRTLTVEEWPRLLGLVQQFLRDKQFEGAGGLEITEEMRLLVAAQACLLILNIDVACYPGVKSIVMYPATFVPKYPLLDGRIHADPFPHPVPLVGEHVRGAVVLSWESAVRGEEEPGDGQNVVLHEFAHELDREDGHVDGMPLLEAPSSTRVWTRVLRQRFEELRQAAEAGEADVLSAYGATNRAEFFAVATESFFERPVEFQRRYPDLYEVLRGFYRQDPAARAAA